MELFQVPFTFSQNSRVCLKFPSPDVVPNFPDIMWRRQIGMDCYSVWHKRVPRPQIVRSSH